MFAVPRHAGPRARKEDQPGDDEVRGPAGREARPATSGRHGGVPARQDEVVGPAGHGSGGAAVRLHEPEPAAVLGGDGVTLGDDFVGEGAGAGPVPVEHGGGDDEDGLDGREVGQDEAQRLAPCDVALREGHEQGAGVHGHALDTPQVAREALGTRVVDGGIGVLAVLKDVIVDEQDIFVRFERREQGSVGEGSTLRRG